ncbi:MAG: citrate synthase [Candidatus Omnitrophota bacterium]|nr:citrate synthase [Candidatus Omnitrophota bacterium]MDZ4242277.1 citrate synthase [Candidatus Omnitrophota bacterium]
MTEPAKLTIEGKTYDLPIVIGTEGEKAVDISKLRAQSGYITYDPGYGNTGCCTSAITFLDGEKGILRYRGYPVEEIAERCTFVETSHLVIYGELPNAAQLEHMSQSFTRHAPLHKDMIKFFDGYPETTHPMGILSAMVCSLSGYHPELSRPEPTMEDIDEIAVLLLSKVRTIAAYAYKKSVGEPYIAPRDDLKYIPNFLNMMFSKPRKEYKIDDTVVSALRTLLILHADHEQNCSTSTVRLVGSSWANLFASVSAGVCALWGPLHGGANQQVVEMLEQIHNDGGNVAKYVAKAKDPNGSYRLMGFGHRVYKNYDPRAKIIKKEADELLSKLDIQDPLLDIAKKLEEVALKDEYFVQRKLYPNVDFYSGIILKAVGIPTTMFPVMFAIGRMPGWIANWKEMKEGSESRIGRPRQIYTGQARRDFVPMDKRA